MSEEEDMEEFDLDFFQNNQTILKQRKYIEENQSQVNSLFSSMIKPNYMYKVGMSFNDHCRI